MFARTAAILIIAFIAASEGIADIWDGLAARWSQNPKNGFYVMPQNTEDAVKEGWTRVSGMDAPDSQTSLAYHGDPRVMLLYSKCDGKVYGIQIAFPVADIKKSGLPVNYDNNRAITRKILNGVEYFTATAHFHKYANNTKRLVLKEYEQFVEYPIEADRLIPETPYHSKRCVTWMGFHFYQISNTTDCGNIFPWALIAVKKNIVVLAFQILGKISSGPKRTWFENLPISQVAYTIPDAPACLSAPLQKYGYSSIHIYLKKDPLDIYCCSQCEVESGPNSGYNPRDYDTSNAAPYTGPPDVCPV